MKPSRKRVAAIFVNRATQQWVVRDPDGKFWVLPFVEDAWEHRQPFEPTEETDLKPVPGYNKHQLGLPF